MLTKPPCGKGQDACPHRYIACHASCEEYHEWLAVHAGELETEKQKKDAEWAADGFLSKQNYRIKIDNIRKSGQRYREKGKA